MTGGSSSTGTTNSPPGHGSGKAARTAGDVWGRPGAGQQLKMPHFFRYHFSRGSILQQLVNIPDLPRADIGLIRVYLDSMDFTGT